MKNDKLNNTLITHTTFPLLGFPYTSDCKRMYGFGGSPYEASVGSNPFGLYKSRLIKMTYSGNRELGPSVWRGFWA